MNDLSRHQILLFHGDFDRLKEYYTIRSASEVIRTLVRQHLAALDKRLAKQKELEHVGERDAI